MPFKTVFTILVLTLYAFFCFGALSAALAELPDAKMTNQELEVMRSIIQTTSGFVSQELNKQNKLSGPKIPSRLLLEESSITSLYLTGQGAVFLIDCPENALGTIYKVNEASVSAYKDAYRVMEAYADLKEEAKAAAKEALKLKEETKSELRQVQEDRAALLMEKKMIEEKMKKEKTGSPAVAKPPAPPSPPAPPQPPPVPPLEEAKAALTVVERDIRKSMEERLELRQARMQEWVKQLSERLRDVLVKHGDSLTVVKPSEYITFVLNGGGNRMGFLRDLEGQASASHHILTIQKGQILEYKKGTLSLEELKAKIIEYTL